MSEQAVLASTASGADAGPSMSASAGAVRCGPELGLPASGTGGDDDAVDAEVLDEDELDDDELDEEDDDDDDDDDLDEFEDDELDDEDDDDDDDDAADEIVLTKDRSARLAGEKDAGV